ncbi:hypothetical protein ID875_04060 [Streptomyces globisporus]|uniref:Uncharacterized protein n=1 Tax=Streptomyces globisporus TaxID=1908 RepID=A0A927BJ75_STRGL|nr:hypothetical protein [Streptomyces globisporus]
MSDVVPARAPSSAQRWPGARTRPSRRSGRTAEEPMCRRSPGDTVG